MIRGPDFWPVQYFASYKTRPSQRLELYFLLTFFETVLRSFPLSLKRKLPLEVARVWVSSCLSISFWCAGCVPVLRTNSRRETARKDRQGKGARLHRSRESKGDKLCKGQTSHIRSLFCANVRRFLLLPGSTACGMLARKPSTEQKLLNFAEIRLSHFVCPF